MHDFQAFNLLENIHQKFTFNYDNYKFKLKKPFDKINATKTNPYKIIQCIKMNAYRLKILRISDIGQIIHVANALFFSLHLGIHIQQFIDKFMHLI